MASKRELIEALRRAQIVMHQTPTLCRWDLGCHDACKQIVEVLHEEDARSRAARERARDKRTADRIDGYDRDDLGPSGDF